MEAAMQAAYGLDPAGLTLRRFWVLLRRLPPGRWTDPEHSASWSVEAHLLAAVVDACNQTAWVVAAANSKRHPPRPKPLPRPGQVAQTRRRGFTATAWEAVRRDGARRR